MQRLIQYFTQGITSKTLKTLGSEVETQFVDEDGMPITMATSQSIFEQLTKQGWKVTTTRGNIITGLEDPYGSTLSYELGRHNIEFGSCVTSTDSILDVTLNSLDQLYNAANLFGAFPYFSPILETRENLLAIPDERDATWLRLDGKDALLPLATTSSVQFTFAVSQDDAMPFLNKLGNRINLFLNDYPQDVVWKKYIAESKAGYLNDRYGGPLLFESMENYCFQLSKHSVVTGDTMVPFSAVENLNIPLFIRSIWWFFRLKRYGNDLCIEVRPMPRRGDEYIQNQLQMVLDIVNV